MKIWVLILILIISTALNVLYFCKSDKYYLVQKKLFPKTYLNKDVDSKTYDSLVISAGLKMMLAENSFKPENGYQWIKSLVSKDNLRYNYHHAFLIDGLLTYAINNEDTKLINQINSHLKTLISSDGKPTKLLGFAVIDQVSYGVSSLAMYKQTNDIRYKKFADFLYKYVVSKDGKFGVMYKEDSNVQFNDVLAMIVPFLYNYGLIFKVQNAIVLADKQVDIFRKYGVDVETGIPAHGYNILTNTKTGSSNWGRGIGWYAIAIAESNSDTTRLTKLFINSMKKLKLTNGFYTQFLGDPVSTKGIDASATALIYYFLVKKGYEVNTQGIFGSITTKEGYVDTSSGETEGMNQYSDIFGYSELTQGILIKTLSKTKVK